MSTWETYPSTYRNLEIKEILKAVQAGDCFSLVGLSGSGKSNLMGFIANRPDVFPHTNALVDCNRLLEAKPDGLYQLIRQSLGDTHQVAHEYLALTGLIDRCLAETGESLTLLLDRFDALVNQDVIANNLRALRDAHKYQLTFVIATRRPINPDTELAELFFGHTVWLGPLSQSDTFWNVTRYAKRLGLNWGEETALKMWHLTGGYPSLLRAACEAFADGTDLERPKLLAHKAIQRRLDEFWADNPSNTEIQNSRLDGNLLLKRKSTFDSATLTEKEYLLLEYFQNHAGEVCTKDDLIRAVWSEDVIYEKGIRDDSLAQLVRRLRVKIEPDPSAPICILTIPGRGYRFTDRDK